MAQKTGKVARRKIRKSDRVARLDRLVKAASAQPGIREAMTVYNGFLESAAGFSRSFTV